MDLLVVVFAQLLLLLYRPRAQGLGEIPLRVTAANHEADLARWVGWNGSVGILDVGEDFSAVLLQVGDQGQVQPLVLGCDTQSVIVHQGLG